MKREEIIRDIVVKHEAIDYRKYRGLIEEFYEKLEEYGLEESDVDPVALDRLEPHQLTEVHMIIDTAKYNEEALEEEREKYDKEFGNWKSKKDNPGHASTGSSQSGNPVTLKQVENIFLSLTEKPHASEQEIAEAYNIDPGIAADIIKKYKEDKHPEEIWGEIEAEYASTGSADDNPDGYKGYKGVFRGIFINNIQNTLEEYLDETDWEQWNEGLTVDLKDLADQAYEDTLKEFLTEEQWNEFLEFGQFQEKLTDKEIIRTGLSEFITNENYAEQNRNRAAELLKMIDTGRHVAINDRGECVYQDNNPIQEKLTNEEIIKRLNLTQGETIEFRGRDYKVDSITEDYITLIHPGADVDEEGQIVDPDDLLQISIKEFSKEYMPELVYEDNPSHASTSSATSNPTPEQLLELANKHLKGKDILAEESDKYVKIEKIYWDGESKSYRLLGGIGLKKYEYGVHEEELKELLKYGETSIVQGQGYKIMDYTPIELEETEISGFEFEELSEEKGKIQDIPKVKIRLKRK